MIAKALGLGLKRLMDVCGAAVCLLLAGPLLALLAAAIRLRMGSPVLFRQERAGREGRVFTVLKLRTMIDARGPEGELLKDAQRLTPLGRWLRRLSLDELPQLWNVLRGEMSLVGPRPLKPDYLPLYSPEQMRRHDVRPGITGWAQVNGRNNLAWPERFALDVWYVDHRSFWLDVAILARTALVAARMRDVSQHGQATAARFEGNHVAGGRSAAGPSPRGGNVLITCAGRRTYLVEAFRNALAGKGQVFAADASPDAPAVQEADRGFLVPRLTDPGYSDALLRLCSTHNVGLLVPQSDLDLLLLTRRRAEFLAIGTLPLVSSPEVIELCWDKWATLQFVEQCGLCVPRTFLSLQDARAALARRELRFPVVVKPRWGVASFGLSYPQDESELTLAYQLLQVVLARRTFPKLADPEHAVLVQACADGVEHGLDIVNDLAGNYATTFARRKVSMRAGETERAMTVADPRLEKVGETIGRRLRHLGSLDCDVFLTADRACLLELNPRLGGGYPFSHLAGANLPAAFLAWSEGREADPAWLQVRPGVSGAKCDRLVVQQCCQAPVEP